ncbi:TlyA family RNA methyltransferase [Mycoplasma todarodis]|uniref:TlyA family rRNA (Cytidine-2'-O)-methyltransferase n=1 Tax=Mycoplasma todarodis TaxID=1937191 RepID=A0A4R0XU97_9MOLU|nr:TlyA family RNA methyltransferase [Mycoplasma todarodis]TCG10431.1 TlyA family rRNA (cytidine-2'-O)-methyltransferase [Mycoplasma todarodis]
MKTALQIIMELGYTKDESEKLIRSGKVKINGNDAFIPSERFKKVGEVFIKDVKKWVSRGAFKLLAAFEEFNLDVSNKVGLDIGSSTGGFTEVLLNKGAKKVYSLDVGTNQLDFSLRRHEKVVALEKTNLKKINKEMFAEPVELVVTDVSFISLKEVFRVLENTLEQGVQLMALIKPQFEAFADQVEEGGYVPERLHQEIIERVIKHSEDFGFKYINHKPSPIKGNKAKNIEYITLFERK